MKELEQEYQNILCQFISNAHIKTVLEFGVCTGISTRAILEALGKNGQLWSIDIRSFPQHPQIKSDYPEWSLTICDDLKVEWNREIDMIFIDTLHRYGQALAELNKFSPFARHWIFLHDTKSNPQVLDAIKTFLTNNNHWMFGEWSHHHGLAILMRQLKSGDSDGA